MKAHPLLRSFFCLFFVFSASLGDSYAFEFAIDHITGSRFTEYRLLPAIQAAPPEIINTPSADTICTGEEITIAIQSNPGTATISWGYVSSDPDISGFDMTGSGDLVQTLTNSGSTNQKIIYEAIATDMGVDSDPFLITITVGPKPVLSASPSDQTICNNTATFVNLSSSVTLTSFVYQFSSPDGVTGGSDGAGNTIGQLLSNPNAADANASYKISGITELSCKSDTILATVKVKADLKASIVSEDTSVCFQDVPVEIRVALEGSGTWNYTVTDGVNVFFENTGSSTSSIDVAPEIGSTVYRLTSANNIDNGVTCSMSLEDDAVLINRFSQVRATITSNSLPLCEEETILNIPITLEGNSPWVVDYTDGIENFRATFVNPSSFVQVFPPLGSAISYELLSVSDANGCIGEVNGSVNVFRQQAASAILSYIDGAANGLVCTGEAAELRVDFFGEGPYDIVWTDGFESFEKSDITGQFVTITDNTLPAQQVTYSLISVTEKNGKECPGEVIGEVTVSQVNLPLQPSGIVGPGEVCQSQENVVYSVAPIPGVETYHWTLPNGFIPSSGNNITESASISLNISSTAEPGSIAVFASNPCGEGPSSSAFEVAVKIDAKTPSSITGDTEACQNSSATFIAENVPNVNQYLWQFTDNDGYNVSRTTSTNEVSIEIPVDFEGGNIKVATENSCNQSDFSAAQPVSALLLPGKVNIAQGPQIACELTSGYIYVAEEEPLADLYTWSLASNLEPIETTSNILSLGFGPSMGFENLNVQTSNECGVGEKSDPYQIEVKRNPIVYFEVPEKVNIGEEFVLFGNSDQPIEEWTWSFGDGNSGEGQEVTHFYQLSNMYNITLLGIDEFSCSSDSALTIEVENDIPIDIKNVITPNGDNANEFLTIEGLELYPTNKVVLINRLGSVVFEAREYDNTYSPVELEPGNYVCIVTLENLDFRKKRAITILK